MPRPRRRLTLICALWLSVHAGMAWAGLGDAIGNGLTDCTAIGPLQIRPDGVQQQAFRASDGTLVTAYANPSGTVFGLAWRAGKPPNLGPWLGQSRHAALQGVTPQGGLHAAGMSGQDIELRTTGTPRGFMGAAWAPSLRPNGFDTGDLQP